MANCWAVALIALISPASTPTIFPVQNMIQTQVGGNKHNIAFLYVGIEICMCIQTDTQVCTAKEQPQSGLGATADLPISSICKLAPGLLGRWVRRNYVLYHCALLSSNLDVPLLVQEDLRSPFTQLTVTSWVSCLGFCHLLGLVLIFLWLCVVPIGVRRLSIFS